MDTPDEQTGDDDNIDPRIKHYAELAWDLAAKGYPSKKIFKHLREDGMNMDEAEFLVQETMINWEYDKKLKQILDGDNVKPDHEQVKEGNTRHDHEQIKEGNTKLLKALLWCIAAVISLCFMNAVSKQPFYVFSYCLVIIASVKLFLAILFRFYKRNRR